jgi:hypothetical protein
MSSAVTVIPRSDKQNEMTAASRSDWIVASLLAKVGVNSMFLLTLVPFTCTLYQTELVLIEETVTNAADAIN